ncbi:hypothetical protein KAT36_04385 [Candidatus Pacearchaeota archaeon]|nr:hypothetical protein [Candidatus Pacearchaeota archaeon]
MNKKLILILSCLLILNSLFLVDAAVDIKMKVRYCEFAVSNTNVAQWKYQSDSGTDESEVFKPWDEATQEGIFLLSENKNTILGEPSSYEFTRYTPEENWFNEFKSDGTKSDIPIINVGVGKDKWIYTRCKFITGDYRIFLYDYGYCDLGYLTNDFNLTSEIIPSDTSSSGTPHTSIYGNYLTHVHPSPRWLNNLNPGESGLFPHTEPYIIYKTQNLAQRPTSLVYFSMGWLVRELGRTSTVSSPQPNKILYINNSNSDYAPENYLTVSALWGDMIKKDENTGETTTGSGSHLKLIPEHNYSTTSFFKNNHGVPLIIDFHKRISQNSWPRSRGVGKGDIAIFPSQPTQKETITFQPGETKSITNNYVIPAGYAIVNAYSYMHIKNSNSPTGGWIYGWPPLGSEAYPYLSFRTIDPRIEMTKVDGKYKPIFNITLDLYGEAYARNLPIAQDDYELEGRIYKNSINDENLEFQQTYPLPSNLPKGDTSFNLQIPVDPSWGEGKYYIKILSKMKKAIEPHPEFKDKYISMYYGNPYFKAGDIAYPYDNKLKFGSDSKIDSEKIVIFNPSFYENDIELNIESWSDENNFILSWDRETFSKNPSTTIHLYPLQSKEINFWVNATYTPWISSSLKESLKINIQSNLKTDDETIVKKIILDFILDVDKDALNWFNINPVKFAPEIILLDSVNSTKNEEITLNWNIEGSDSKWEELAEKPYEVKIKLINGSEPTGEVLKETIATFGISEDETTELTFDYDFNYGEYLVILDLDSNDQIAEKYSSGDDAEEDNYNIYSIPFLITYCYYHEDGYMHRINFFGEDVIDKENKCTCSHEFVTIPNEGYCADPYSEICLTFNSYPICNNWIQSKPGLCGWEAEISLSTTPGYCLPCNNISNTCSGYNNKESCETDPCYKAFLYDCTAFKCDTSQEYRCIWDGTLNQCQFKSTINGNSCTYFGNIIQECNGTNNKMIVDYTSDDIGCDSSTREVICGQGAIILNFFSKISLITAILIVTLFYIFKKNPNPHKRAK